MFARLSLRHGHLQTLVGARPLQFLIAAQKTYVGNHSLGAVLRHRQRANDQLSLGRPVQRNCIEDVALGGEPHIGNVAAVEETILLDHIADLAGWSLAVDFPWPRSEDTLTIDCHPRGQILEDLAFPIINRSVATQGDIQQEIAILADDVHQDANNLPALL